MVVGDLEHNKSESNTKASDLISDLSSIQTQIIMLANQDSSDVLHACSKLSESSEVHEMLKECTKRRLPHPSTGLSDLQNFKTLRFIHDLYPEQESPSNRALKRMACIHHNHPNIEDTTHDTVLCYLEDHYNLMRQARLALEAAQYDKINVLVKDILSNPVPQLTAVRQRSDQEIENFHESCAPENSAHCPTIPLISNNIGTSNIEAICKMYLRRKNNDRNLKKNDDGDSVEALETIRMCMVVHKLIGKFDVTSITVEDGDLALEKLRMMPKVNQSKHDKEKFHPYPISDWIKINEKVKRKTVLESTVGRYLEKAATIYKWIEKHLKLDTHNPFSGLGTKKESHNKADDVNPFEKKDLLTIFSQPIFTSHTIKRHKTKKIYNYSQFWLPLIALLSGMRPNEIAQLKAKNIHCKHGILHFVLSNSDEDQSLKNRRAKRLVPVHSTLLSLGFEKYLQRFHSDDLLFPELTYSKKGGYYKNHGEWFSRYFSKLINLSAEKKRFSSFRHNFINHFKQSGVLAAVPAALVGHENGTITYDRYGSKAELEKLKEAVETIKFDHYLEQVKPFEWLE
ncbi:site-specific integrase [Vibrio barjaei]|uniref:Site-specific integrase n=1 Tax=Vibrio barjaei TaxID=1676683 RepID=A0ABW7IJY5_9VIBR